MSRPQATLARFDFPVKGLRQLVEIYAQTHGVEIWFWEKLAGEWSPMGYTSAPQGSAPGPDAVSLTLRKGVEGCVEVSPSDRAHGAFLAALFQRVLEDQNEAFAVAAELAESYEEITLLYSISEILGSVISLEAAAGRILAEVTDTLGVKRAALWIHDAQNDLLDLVAAVGPSGRPGPIPVDDENSITATVFRERRSRILESGDVFPREGPRSDGAHLDSFLSVPVSYTPPHGESRTIGVINLVGRTVDISFSAGDRKLISAIASQIGAAVENSRLVADSLSQERMVREMELAHDLQLKLLPPTAQFQGDAEVAARCMPAESVGGDFYHLFRLPGGRLGVVIGDVSSHGFSAALIMALTMSAVAIHASEGDPPAEVLRRVHRALIDELETTEMYLTLFYGVIDPTKGILSFANAGHSHAFLVRPKGIPVRLPTTNPPFGIINLDDYREQSIAWQARQDLLFLFTDGLSDAVSLARGEQILVELVATRRHQSADQLISALFDVERPKHGVPSDDRTAVLVRI